MTSSRKNRTICIPFCKSVYMNKISNAEAFRADLDRQIAKFPEIFPAEIVNGYLMKEIRQLDKNNRPKLHILSFVRDEFLHSSTKPNKFHNIQVVAMLLYSRENALLDPRD